jgi:phytoene synthase
LLFYPCLPTTTASKRPHSGSSFYYSFLFLPPERRRAITALYAFAAKWTTPWMNARTNPLPASSWPGGARKSQHVRGQQSHPVTRRCSRTGPYNLKEEHLQAIIDGMEMDLNQTRYLDYAALSKYCWHVASVVGILSASIFGVTNPQTLRLRKSWACLPAHQHHPRCRRRCAQRPHLPAHQRAAAVQRHCRRHPQRAPQRKIRAADGLPGARAQQPTTKPLPCCPRKTARPAPGLMMAAIYRTLLTEVEADGYHVLTSASRSRPSANCGWRGRPIRG